MFRFRSECSGEFDIFIDAAGKCVEGILKWSRCDSDGDDSAIDVHIHVKDEKFIRCCLNENTNEDSEFFHEGMDDDGYKINFGMGKLTVYIVRRNARRLHQYGMAQQILLSEYIRSAKEKVERSQGGNFRCDQNLVDFIEAYGGEETKFYSLLYYEKNNPSKSPWAFVKAFWRRVTIGPDPYFHPYAHMGGEDKDGNPCASDLAVQEANWWFRTLVIIFGLITSIFCIFKIGKSDRWEDAIVVMTASITAWAVREHLLVKEYSRDVDYLFSTHFRSAIWKLVGIATTGLVSLSVLKDVKLL